MHARRKKIRTLYRKAQQCFRHFYFGNETGSRVSADLARRDALGARRGARHRERHYLGCGLQRDVSGKKRIMPLDRRGVHFLRRDGSRLTGRLYLRFYLLGRCRGRSFS
jgi:hypothetical protein